MKVTFPYMQVHPLSASVCRGGLCSLSKADHTPTCTVNDRLTASNKLYAFHNFFFFYKFLLIFGRSHMNSPMGSTEKQVGRQYALQLQTLAFLRPSQNRLLSKSPIKESPGACYCPPRSQFSIQRGTSPHMLQSNRRIQVGNS